MSNKYLMEFQNSSPIWRIIKRKEQFGLKEKGLCEKAIDYNYYKGYSDACGELMEHIEDFYMDMRDSPIENKSKFTQEFMLRRYGIQSALGLATTDNDGKDE